MNSVFQNINLEVKIPNPTSVPWVRADSDPLSKCTPPSPPQPRNTLKPCLINVGHGCYSQVPQLTCIWMSIVQKQVGWGT